MVNSGNAEWTRTSPWFETARGYSHILCRRKPDHMATITSGQKAVMKIGADQQCQPLEGNTENRSKTDYQVTK